MSEPGDVLLGRAEPSWSVAASPAIADGGQSELSGVTAMSANDVGAVGEANGLTTLTEHWSL